MRTVFYILMLVVGLSATAQSQTTYTLDPFASSIQWKGSYSFSFSSHTGTLHFKEGELTTNNGTITGGTFVVDMTTLSNEDHLMGRGPVAHLKNEDFFDVEKFPEATLVITKVNYSKSENRHEMQADLTLKGITKPIIFRAYADGPKKQLSAQLKLDRTLWGITYNNKLKNEAISDAMELDVLLQF